MAKSLSAEHKIEVIVDNNALAGVGMPPDTPITLTLKSVPLESVLALLLRPLDLTWTIRDNALVITTPEDAERVLISATYNVRDLLAATGGNANPLVSLIYSTLSPTSWNQVGGQGSLWTPSSRLVVGTRSTSRFATAISKGLC